MKPGLYEQIINMEMNGGIGKDSDAGRHWGQEEKGTTEDTLELGVLLFGGLNASRFCQRIKKGSHVKLSQLINETH